MKINISKSFFLKGIITLILISGLVAASYLSQRSQEIRPRASGTTDGITLKIKTTKTTLDFNQSVRLTVTLDTQSDNVGVALLHFSYPSDLIEITKIESSGVFRDTLESGKIENGSASITLGTGIVDGKPNIIQGVKDILYIDIKTKNKAGNASITITPDSIVLTDKSQNNVLKNSVPLNININSSAPTAVPTIKPTSIPTVTPTIVAGVDPILKFRIAFTGINPVASCALPKDLPLSLTVRNNDGASKTYTNIIATKTNNTSGNLAYYDVTLRLTGFKQTSKFSVFIKSPKHLQMKYGINDQNGYYDKADGELDGLTSNPDTTPVFSFEKYPLLAGDITGLDGKQDGVIDAKDFVIIKAETLKRTETIPGSHMLSDINGNCKMESQDLSLLMISLSTTQRQLY